MLASVREGSPVALLELMALGLASVVTTTPGMGDTVVDGETAVVVPARDAEALRAALAGLLADPARVARLGTAARAAADGSRWSVRAREPCAVPRGARALVRAPVGTTRLMLLLLAGALVLRLGVIAVASLGESDDISNDIEHHALLVDDPVGHLLDSPGIVAQYPPYLGFAEWVTVKPWIALGASEATVLRLGSSVWDLAGMAVLLLVVAGRRRSDVLIVGALWGAALLFWPTSALLGQDETIAAAFVAVALLLAARHRLAAACVVLVVGLFVAKVFLLAVLAAFLFTAPALQRRQRLVGQRDRPRRPRRSHVAHERHGRPLTAAAVRDPVPGVHDQSLVDPLVASSGLRGDRARLVDRARRDHGGWGPRVVVVPPR